MRVKDVIDSVQSEVEEASVREVPAYYTMALQSFCVLIVFYFFCYVVMCMFLGYPDSCGTAIPWLAALALLFFFYESVPIRWMLRCISALILTWVIVFVMYHGWECGVQHFIIPLMIVVIFSIYTSLRSKVVMSIALLTIRLLLFVYCKSNEPFYPFETTVLYGVQVLHTVFIGICVVCICLIFSTNIQRSEKQLLVCNEELKRQASTDMLTGLKNRRCMMDMLERQVSEHPQENFSVAMGDVDFFKKINDDYGHECGDEVLCQLAKLFQTYMTGDNTVCRWDGEEFFFFMPRMNLDEASSLITDMNIAISETEIKYKEIACNVTMTFGVEEYDFASGLKDILKSTDDKLYHGKNNGRNQVVF